MCIAQEELRERYSPFLYGVHPGTGFRLSGKLRIHTNNIVSVWAYITLGSNPVLYGDFGIRLPRMAKRMDFPWIVGVYITNPRTNKVLDCVGYIDGDKITRIVPMDDNVNLTLEGGDQIHLFTMYQESV